MLVGFSGKISSGKDTVGAELAKLYSENVHLSMSRILHEEVDEFINQAEAAIVSMSEMPQYLPNVSNITYKQASTIFNKLKTLYSKSNDIPDSHDRNEEMRFILQYWGTEIRRMGDPNYWVDHEMGESLKHMPDLHSPDKLVYYTDIRFPNEAKMIHSMGGLLVRINASESVRRERCIERSKAKNSNILLEIMTAEAEKHPSEISLDDYAGFDVIIQNDGDRPAELIAHIIYDRINMRVTKVEDLDD
jgi:dephospho-CoA kinase